MRKPPRGCGPTTCAFAQNVFWEYWNASDGASSQVSQIEAFSATLGRRVPMSCEGEDPVVCSNDAGAEVRMPAEALSAYTQEAADAYAVHHTVGGG